MTLPTYETLYEKYHRLSKHIISRNLGLECDDIDDLQQEVWLKIHRRIGELPEVDNIKSWLRWIIRGVLSDHKEKNQAQKRGAHFEHVHTIDGHTEDANFPLPDQFLDAAHIQAKFVTCLEKLSPRRRQIFQMRLKDAPFKEIAVVLDSNDVSVRSLHSKAKQEMWDCMSKSDEIKEPLSDGQLKAAMEGYLEAKLKGSAHVSEEILKYFITDLLDDDEADEVRDHLALCTTCKSKWRELMYLDGLIKAELDSNDPQTQTETPEQVNVVPIAETKPEPLKRFGPYFLAASILFAMFFVPQPKQDPPSLEPRVIPFSEVGSTELVRRSAERNVPVLDQSEERFLQLIYVEEKPIQNYRLELTALDEATVLWQDDAPPRDDTGTFSVLIKAAFLTPGDYELRLSGDGQELHTYPFRVR